MAAATDLPVDHRAHTAAVRQLQHPWPPLRAGHTLPHAACLRIIYRGAGAGRHELYFH